MTNDRELGAVDGALRVFRCVYAREYRTAEIADAVGLSQQTVQAHLNALRDHDVPMIKRQTGRSVSWRIDRIALYDAWADIDDRDRGGRKRKTSAPVPRPPAAVEPEESEPEQHPGVGTEGPDDLRRQ